MPKNSQFIPPALPPKKQKLDSSNASLNNIALTPPISPRIRNDDSFYKNKTEDLLNEGESAILNKPKINENQNVNVEKFTNNDESKEMATVVLRKKPSEVASC